MTEGHYPVKASPGTTGRRRLPASTPAASGRACLRRCRASGDIHRFEGGGFAQVRASRPVALAIARADFGNGSGIITFPPRPPTPNPCHGSAWSTPPRYPIAIRDPGSTRSGSGRGWAAVRASRCSTAPRPSMPTFRTACRHQLAALPARAATATLASMGAATGHVGAVIVLRTCQPPPVTSTASRDCRCSALAARHCPLPRTGADRSSSLHSARTRYVSPLGRKPPSTWRTWTSQPGTRRRPTSKPAPLLPRC